MYQLLWAIVWPAVNLFCLLILLFTRHRSSPGAYASSASFFAGWAAVGEAPHRYWWIAPIYVICLGLLIGVKLGFFISRQKRR